MVKRVFIALVFMLAMLASIKTVAQTTDITAYCRAEVNCAFEFMQDVKKFYFEGDYIVFKLGDGTTTTMPMSAIKKMTLTYNQGDLTDVDEFSGKDGFYPNPVSDMLYFNFNVGTDVIMQIYSATGQLVKEENLSSDGTIDVSDLNEGLYIVRIDGKTYKFCKL